MSDRHRFTIAAAVSIAYGGALWATFSNLTVGRALGYFVENVLAAFLSVIVQRRSQRHERLIAAVIAVFGGLVATLGFSAIGFVWASVHVLALVSGWQWLTRPSTLDGLLSGRWGLWRGGIHYVVLAIWFVVVVIVTQPGLQALPLPPILALLWIVGIPANVACVLAPRHPVIAGVIANLCPMFSAGVRQSFNFLLDGPPEGVLLLVAWVGFAIGGSLVYSVPVVMYERHQRERAACAAPAGAAAQW